MAVAGSACIYSMITPQARAIIDDRKNVQLFASAYMDDSRRFGVVIMEDNGRVISKHLLPGRGHGMTFNNHTGQLISFSRRPGNFAMAFNMYTRTPPVLFQTPSYTHFYGHGTFSKDGRLLFATENDFHSGDGVIGVYDATNEFVRINEFPSHGIGPHEIIMMHDGYTLCIANGGILTHPDTGRTKLNLHEMQSSVAFIDSRYGDLISIFDVPVQRLSLRHMVVDCNNLVWVGGQYEGDIYDIVPLIATIDVEDGITFVSVDSFPVGSLSNYIGSIASSSDGTQVAVSSPKGNTLLIFDVVSQSILSMRTIKEVCGVSATNDNSFMTTSMSGITDGDSSSFLYFDNHITSIHS